MVAKIEIRRMPKVTVAMIFYQGKHLVEEIDGFPESTRFLNVIASREIKYFDL